MLKKLRTLKNRRNATKAFESRLNMSVTQAEKTKTAKLKAEKSRKEAWAAVSELEDYLTASNFALYN